MRASEFDQFVKRFGSAPPVLPLPLNEPLTLQIIDWHTENFLTRSSSSFGNHQEEAYEPESEESEDEQPDWSQDSDSDDDRRHVRPVKKQATESKRYHIYVFAKDLQNRTFCVKVIHFTPFFYILLPDGSNESTASAMEDWIREQLPNPQKKDLVSTKLMYRHRFRNFDNFKKYPFLRLVFRNTETMMLVTKYFQRCEVHPVTQAKQFYPKPLYIPKVTNGESFIFELFENKVDPLLKFIHQTDIKPVGWFQIAANQFELADNPKSRCQYDIVVNWKQCKAVEIEQNTGIKIMAFDIECDSSHGDFPLPIKDYTKLARELFTAFLRIDTERQKQVALGTPEGRKRADELVEQMTRKKEFVVSVLNDAFGQGNREKEISKVYYQSKSAPSERMIEIVGEQLANSLKVSRAEMAKDRDKQNAATTDELKELMNNSFPPVHGDKTIQIALSFLRYGESRPYRNVMMTVGTCNPLSNAETYSFTNERDLLQAYQHCVWIEDPDVITGYNIDGFDTLWLFRRASELQLSSFNLMGRFLDIESTIESKQVKSYTNELVEVQYVTMPGRIQMDLMPMVQKNYQLDSYKLDDVAANFMNGEIKKVDVTEEEYSIVYLKKKDALKGLYNNNYVMFKEVDGYNVIKYREGEKFEIDQLNLEEASFRVKHPLQLNFQKTCSFMIGKDDTSPQDIFRLQKGNASDRYIIAKYCMMDTILCIELLLKLEFLTNCIGMANVCYTPLSWVIHRGQSIKLLSLLCYKLKSLNYLMPTIYPEKEKLGYLGAFVLPPKCKVYGLDEPITVLDYGSLYPSSMRECNISHETLVMNPEYLGDEGKAKLEALGFDVCDITYDNIKAIYNSKGKVKEKMVIGKETSRYVQYRNGKKGIVPDILEMLVNQRKLTRKRIEYQKVTYTTGEEFVGTYDEENKTIKTEKQGTITLDSAKISQIVDAYNSFQQKVLDGLQLAYKVVANSLYGQCGASVSQLYNRRMAASTTAIGRERLLVAKHYVENQDNFPQVMNDGRTIFLKNEIIYGDTDSVFCKLQVLDADGNSLSGQPAIQRSIDLGFQIEKAINAKLKAPQNINYEKVMCPLILASRKRYVGNLYEFDSNKYKLKSMGIVLKRRDNAPILKIMYGSIIDQIMKTGNITKAAEWLRRELTLFTQSNKYSIDTLVLSKNLNPYYKDPEKIAHKVLQMRCFKRDPGSAPQTNERIQFVYVEVDPPKDGRKLLQGELIETPEFIKANKLKPDLRIYVEKQLMKPISQVFALSLDKVPYYHGPPMSEFDKMYQSLLDANVDDKAALKKVLEKKRKYAEPLLFGEVLRRLDNAKKKNNEITKYFRMG